MVKDISSPNSQIANSKKIPYFETLWKIDSCQKSSFVTHRRNKQEQTNNFNALNSVLLNPV